MSFDMQLGRFSVSAVLMFSDPITYMDILKRFIIIDVERNPESDMITYIAASEMFDALLPGEPIPSYGISVMALSQGVNIVSAMKQE